MALKMTVLKCPQCGADLEPLQGREIMYCTYCGAPIALDDDSTFTYRIQDDADVQRARTEHDVRMRQLDLDERDARDSRTRRVAWVALSVGLLLLGILLTVVGGTAATVGLLVISIAMYVGLGGLITWQTADEQARDRRNQREGKVRPGSSSAQMRGKNYLVVERNLKSAGFTDIALIPVRDVRSGWRVKPGQVDSVSIAGRDTFAFNEWFSPDATVTITYYSS